MNIYTYKDIFTDNELKLIENDEIVQFYKLDAINKNKKVAKFTIPIGEDIKSKLKLYDIMLEKNISELPMMWIKGDIHKHIDKASSQFSYTNLIYITTDENGKLIIDGTSFPIIKGYGYCFKEGLEHETIGTDVNKMRLMIGPISEKGFSVGAAPSIFYLLDNPPNYTEPYFTPSDNSKFIDATQIPSGKVVAPPYALKGWYVYYVDDSNAPYKVGDIVPPNTPYIADYAYWVYPVWEIPPPTPKPATTMGKSTYSDNSLVYYKPHSLAPGGTAGVTNVRVKSRRT